MNNRRMWAWLFVTALLGLSCQLVTGTGSGNPAAAYGVKRDEGLFLAGGQPQTLDPATTLSGPDSIVGHVFSGLVQLDTQLQVQPDLAAGWQVSEDGTLYTFFLRHNAVFHDGRPVTAADVVFSWERATDPGLASDTALTYLGDIVGVAEKVSGAADHIAGVRQLDDYTLQVQIDAPKVYFLAKLTLPVAFVVDRENVAAPDWEHHANGTGPFRLQVWKDDEIIVLDRNEQYYRTPPALAHVVVLMGAGIPLSLYETGQIDMVGVGGSTLERLRDVDNPLSTELQMSVDFCTSYVGFNAGAPPFDDVRVRQAFTLAIDREQLARTLFGEDAILASGPLPPGMPGYQPPNPLPFDISQARQLLAEAGYPNPTDLPPITFATDGYEDIGPLVTTLITRWRQNLGVTITPTLIDPYRYSQSLYDNPANLFTYGWCADYPDPENFLDVLYYSGSPQNLGRFHDADLDALLLQARSTADVTARLALYAQTEQRLVAAAPALFITHPLSAILVKPTIYGYTLTPMGVPQWQNLSRQSSPQVNLPKLTGQDSGPSYNAATRRSICRN
ncbi:MAG: peptide ABC transporter substrate-binding protein [Ardenticatenales bacterium]|nr:peptide ABC transporter substrate-binding protein [Ardenticatenales bacterium]